MKNYKLFALLLFLFLSGYGQRSNTKTLEKFTELKVYDKIVVSLLKSDENKLIITGDNKDGVDVSQKDGLLKIKMEVDDFSNRDGAKATLYFTEELILLDAIKNGKIISNETLKGNKLQIRGEEGGVIDLKVSLNEVMVRTVTGSEITLKGTCKLQEVFANTGGKAYHQELNTTETNVIVMAGGRADVKATDLVKAKVKAGGSIYIYGNPKSIEKDKTFGGEIQEMN